MNPYTKAKRALKIIENRSITDNTCIHCGEPVVCFRGIQEIEHDKECPINHIEVVMGLVLEAPSFGSPIEDESCDYAECFRDG